MTHLIVLAGLVSVEKAALTVELAQHYTENGQQVAVIDNIARMPVAPEALPAGTITERLILDLTQHLAATLAPISADVIVVAASENIHPEALILTLDGLDPVYDVQTWALIDTRTCDCFPQVRLLLEDYADAVYHVPVTVAEILGEAWT